jgi:hypothetical protein
MYKSIGDELYIKNEDDDDRIFSSFEDLLNPWSTFFCDKVLARMEGSNFLRPLKDLDKFLNVLQNRNFIDFRNHQCFASLMFELAFRLIQTFYRPDESDVEFEKTMKPETIVYLLKKRSQVNQADVLPLLIRIKSFFRGLYYYGRITKRELEYMMKGSKYVEWLFSICDQCGHKCEHREVKKCDACIGKMCSELFT